MCPWTGSTGLAIWDNTFADTAVPWCRNTPYCTCETKRSHSHRTLATTPEAPRSGGKAYPGTHPHLVWIQEMGTEGSSCWGRQVGRPPVQLLALADLSDLLRFLSVLINLRLRSMEETSIIGKFGRPSVDCLLKRASPQDLTVKAPRCQQIITTGNGASIRTQFFKILFLY